MSMELQIFKTLWGHAGGMDDAISACCNSEWDGIEGQAPATAIAKPIKN